MEYGIFPEGGSKVSVEGLSADVVLSGNTVTVKQGTKVVESVSGDYEPILYHYYFTKSGYTTHSQTIPNTSGKAGTMIVVLGEYNQGNDPYSTMSVTRQSSKTGIVNDKVGNDGKARFIGLKFTFSAGPEDIVLRFASGIQQATTHVVCSYVTY